MENSLKEKEDNDNAVDDDDTDPICDLYCKLCQHYQHTSCTHKATKLPQSHLAVCICSCIV